MEPMAGGPLKVLLVTSALLFSIGLVGFLSRRNMILMFLCTELMFQAAALAFVANGSPYTYAKGIPLPIAPEADCPGAPKGSQGGSYWGYRVNGKDVVVLLESWKPDGRKTPPPRTIAAIIPKPPAGGQVYGTTLNNGCAIGDVCLTGNLTLSNLLSIAGDSDHVGMPIDIRLDGTTISAAATDLRATGDIAIGMS